MAAYGSFARLVSQVSQAPVSAAAFQRFSAAIKLQLLSMQANLTTARRRFMSQLPALPSVPTVQFINRLSAYHCALWHGPSQSLERCAISDREIEMAREEDEKEISGGDDAELEVPCAQTSFHGSCAVTRNLGAMINRPENELRPAEADGISSPSPIHNTR